MVVKDHRVTRNSFVTYCVPFLSSRRKKGMLNIKITVACGGESVWFEGVRFSNGAMAPLK